LTSKLCKIDIEDECHFLLQCPKLEIERKEFLELINKEYKYFNSLRFMRNDQKIEVVEKHKYLGVILTYNGNLKHAADQLCNEEFLELINKEYKYFNSLDVNNKFTWLMFSEDDFVIQHLYKLLYNLNWFNESVKFT
jgi:inorganic pyrophosphatase/exopolyphosphatase